MADFVRVRDRLSRKPTGRSPAIAPRHVDRNARVHDAVVRPRAGIPGLIERDEGGDLLQQRLPVRRAAARAASRIVERGGRDERPSEPHIGRARQGICRHRPARLRLALSQCGRRQIQRRRVRIVRSVVADSNERRVECLRQVDVDLRLSRRRVARAVRERRRDVDGEAQQTGHDAGRYDEVERGVNVAALGVVAHEACLRVHGTVLRWNRRHDVPYAADTPLNGEHAIHIEHLPAVEGRILSAPQIGAHPGGLVGHQSQAVVRRRDPGHPSDARWPGSTELPG